MKAVILAGGLGSRLKPFTDKLPKPLLPINGEQTVLEIQIQQLKTHGVKDIYIATNYLAELIESHMGDGSKYGVNLTFSREKKPLGTCGPLSLLKSELTEPFIVMNGDIITDLNFENLYTESNQSKSNITVCTKELVRPFNFGNVIVKNNEIVKIQEKPDMRFLIVAGVYFMKPPILNYIPDNKFYGIDNLIQFLLNKSEPISTHLIKDYWIDVGSFEDLDKARKDIRDRNT